MQSFPNELLLDLRKHLEEEKTALQHRIDELSHQDPFTDPDRTIDNAASDIEASEESNHDRVSAMVDELKAKVTSLDDALLRIGNGTYGFCTSCHQMIDTDRLSVLPTATLCRTCEENRKAKGHR